MKINHWVLGGLVCLAATVLPAQEAKPSPAPFDSVPGAAKTSVLQPPAMATVKQEAVNVRGQAAFAGEIIAHVKKGQTVSILEQITLAKPKAGEPVAWSRIALPPDAAVYVFADYVDTNTMTVSAKSRINLRGGPGENFSVLGRLEKGAPVKEIRRTQNWIQIEPPANSYGFVATEYLALQPPASPAPEPVVPPATTVPPPATTPEPVIPQPSPTVTNPPPPTPIPTNTPPPAAAVAPDPVAPPTAPAPGTPPPATTVAPVPDPVKADSDQRMITREGYVRRTKDPQAPTDFELKDIQTGDVTEFLLTTDAKFKVYAGARVSVTGPEMLDTRWPKTPILQVKTIFLMP